MNKLNWIAAPAAVLGVLLVVASFLLPKQFARSGWSEAEAETRQKQAAEFHRLSYQKSPTPRVQSVAASPSGAVETPELAEARVAYEQSTAKLVSSQGREAFWGSLLQWSGMLLIVVSAALVGWQRYQEG